MNGYLFEDRPLSSFQRLAASSNADVIVFGHTHRPSTKLVDGVRFVNAGSVGKPKDGDWRACYVILQPDRADEAVEFVRLEYDIDRAMRAIRETDLPREFADDLRQQSGATAPARRLSTNHDYWQQVGPQQLFASGFRARTNALANRSSTCGAMASTSTPLSVRNARASSIL